MKNILRMFCLLICVAMILPLVGCAEESPYPEGYEKYKAVVGDLIPDALKKLKLKESDLREPIPNIYMYQVPGTYSFCGYEFDLYLEEHRGYDRISGFVYWAYVDDISGVVALREKLIELYGEPVDYQFTEEGLQTLIQEKQGAVGNSWSMYRFTEEHHPEYAKCLDEYVERYNKKYGLPIAMAWNLTFSVRYDDTCDQYKIEMQFGVGRDLTPSWQAGEDRS